MKSQNIALLYSAQRHWELAHAILDCSDTNINGYMNHIWILQLGLWKKLNVVL